jgi:ATP-dependent Lon protease
VSATPTPLVDWPTGLVPCLYLRGVVLLPREDAVLFIARPSSIAVLRSIGDDGLVFTVTQNRPDEHEPTPRDVSAIGCIARARWKPEALGDGTFKLVVEGLERAALDGIERMGDADHARIRRCLETRGADPEAAAARLRRTIADVRLRSEAVQAFLFSIGDLPPVLLEDHDLDGDVMSLAWKAGQWLPPEIKREILAADDVTVRLDLVRDGIAAQVGDDRALAERWCKQIREVVDRMTQQADLLGAFVASEELARSTERVRSSAMGLGDLATSLLRD